MKCRMRGGFCRRACLFYAEGPTVLVQNPGVLAEPFVKSTDGRTLFHTYYLLLLRPA